MHAIGGVVYVRAKATGQQLSEYVTSPKGTARVPAVVDLGESEEHWYAFVAAAGGRLSKLDLATPLPATLPLAVGDGHPQVRQIQRSSCPLEDTFIAEPIVQRRADSNAGFTPGKDIVMVATALGCGDTTGNQVLAFDAADITQPPLWVFNSGEFEIGRIHSCLLDLAHNRLVCGAENPSGSLQYGVFSIDTNDGSLVWGSDYGANVHARVAFGTPGGPGADHIYVGDQSGHVRSFDAADGTLRGDAYIRPATYHDPWAIDFDLVAAAGDFSGIVLAIGGGGVMTAVYDEGTDFIELWQATADDAVTAPIVISELAKAYVGLKDGRFSQFDLATGSDDANSPIGSLGTVPYYGGMALSAYVNADGGWRVVGTYDYLLPNSQYALTRQYRVPCVPATRCQFYDVIFRDDFE
ncbi:MAG: PQQ-binding-like beta-propeller repeat protein [Xanthomonadales bacterium]|nr:PQQ-binding-like beta-propeller repeat protein [Xanthomonadales bacterium]